MGKCSKFLQNNISETAISSAAQYEVPDALLQELYILSKYVTNDCI